MRRGTGLTAVTALVGLLALTACGARLTDEQRAAAIGSGGGAGITSGATTDGGTGVVTTGGATTTAGQTATTGTPATTTSGTTVPTTSGATGRPGTGATTTTTGKPGVGAGSPGTPTGTAAPTVDTRDAPAGGNGGSTDKGITGDTITIANVSDISGPVPGLFEDAALATRAYVAYFNATEGTIYGRKLKLLSLDSRLDTGANRAASLEECSKAFAGVGSVSAFDQGGAPVIQSCGIPDLRGLSTTDQMKAVPNAIPINSSGRGGERSMAEFGWAAEKFPDAIKNAAYIFIDGEVTRQLANQDADGAEKLLGYHFTQRLSIGLAETNYGPIVQKLKTSKARYVTFVGAYQQAAALAKTFKQQGYQPDVFQPKVTAYTPDFIKAAGDAANGVYVAVVASLNEEIASNPELQLYAKWLNQVSPGATPTGIGQFSWAAARLFVEQMKAIGPKPTRAALLASVNKIATYTGGGLFPPQGIASRRLSGCTSVVQVQNGRFVRFEPLAPRSLRCKDKVYNSRTGGTSPALGQ